MEFRVLGIARAVDEGGEVPSRRAAARPRWLRTRLRSPFRERVAPACEEKREPKVAACARLRRTNERRHGLIAARGSVPDR